jgi:hypothetical protein
MTADHSQNSKNEDLNQYERIMVAAREARRLNDHYRHRGIEPKTRVTTEAIERVFVVGVPFSYGEDPHVPVEEAMAAPMSDRPASPMSELTTES